MISGHNHNNARYHLKIKQVQTYLMKGSRKKKEEENEQGELEKRKDL